MGYNPTKEAKEEAAKGHIVKLGSLDGGGISLGAPLSAKMSYAYVSPMAISWVAIDSNGNLIEGKTKKVEPRSLSEKLKEWNGEGTEFRKREVAGVPLFYFNRSARKRFNYAKDGVFLRSLKEQFKLLANTAKNVA